MTSNGLIRLQVKWRGFGHNFNEFIGAAANHDNNVVATYMRKHGLNPTAAATIGQTSSKGATKLHPRLAPWHRFRVPARYQYPVWLDM